MAQMLQYYWMSAVLANKKSETGYQSEVVCIVSQSPKIDDVKRRLYRWHKSRISNTEHWELIHRKLHAPTTLPFNVDHTAFPGQMSF